jgi:MFS family permease
MADSLESATMRKIYWRLVPLLFLMMFFNYLDRINIGFAALEMNRQLNLTPEVFGFAGSIFFFGYMLFEVPSNLFLHRLGARRWISGILLVWGAIAAGTALVSSDWSLYILRFSLGVIEAGFLPGVAVYLTHWFPARYRARAVGGYIIAGSFSAVLGGPVSTALLTYADGRLGLQGWQWMFVVEGIPAVFLGLFALHFMTECPADADWLEPAEKEWLGPALDNEREMLGGDASHLSWPRVASDARVWTLACLFGCALIGIYGLLLWLPQIIMSLGNLSKFEVGLLTAVPPMMGVVGTIAVSRNSDRTGDRKKHLAFVYGMSALAIAGCACSPNAVTAYALLCVTGLFIYSGNPLFWSLAASFRGGAAGAATIALINTIAQFGGLVGPWGIGLMRSATGDFKLALLAISASLVIAAILALILRVAPPQDTSDGLMGGGSSRPTESTSIQRLSTRYSP